MSASAEYGSVTAADFASLPAELLRDACLRFATGPEYVAMRRTCVAWRDALNVLTNEELEALWASAWRAEFPHAARGVEGGARAVPHRDVYRTLRGIVGAAGRIRAVAAQKAPGLPPSRFES